MTDPKKLIWAPENGPYFEHYRPADNAADIRGAVILDGETGRWEAFAPFGSIRGVKPTRDEAKQIVEQYLKENEKE